MAAFTNPVVPAGGLGPVQQSRAPTAAVLHAYVWEVYGSLLQVLREFFQ